MLHLYNNCYYNCYANAFFILQIDGMTEGIEDLFYL